MLSIPITKDIYKILFIEDEAKKFLIEEKVIYRIRHVKCVGKEHLSMI